MTAHLDLSPRITIPMVDINLVKNDNWNIEADLFFLPINKPDE